jgi:peptidoglycan/xylan/chitin deacetylase (PgdA/CDA1 family)
MALPDDYLRYPQRAYGMDQARYPWRTPDRRPAIAWPGGRTVACMLVVPIEHHPLDPSGKPFKHPGAMVTPYPDLRHFTSRDYGNRVGVFRLLDKLARFDLKATFPINARALERLAPLVDAIVAAGHEVAAYGLATDHIHWGGLEPAIEARWVAEVRERFERVGLEPRTWLSPARQQSFATLDLIAERGFDLCLDWEQDTVPVAMATAHGPVTALPLSNELDDRTLLIDRRQTEEDWVAQIVAAVDYTDAEASRRGGQCVGFTLTPYVAGQPFRIAAVDRLLRALAENPRAWCCTASELAAAASIGA